MRCSHGCLRLRLAPAPPSQGAQQLGSELTPRPKTRQHFPRRGRHFFEGIIIRRVNLYLFRCAIQCVDKPDSSRPPPPTAALHSARQKPILNANRNARCVPNAHVCTAETYGGGGGQKGTSQLVYRPIAHHGHHRDRVQTVEVQKATA